MTSKKIRLLFDANPLVKQKTGVGYYTEGVIKALSQITELELRGHYFKLRGVEPKLPVATNISYSSNPWLLGQFVKALRKIGIRLPWELLAWHKADVLFFPDFTTWPSLFRKPKIVTVHDLTYVDYPQFVTKKNLRFLQRYTKRDARKANLILTVSQFSKERITKEFDIPPEKVLVTPIPPQPLINSGSKTKLPEKFILFLGTIEPRKNVSVLIDAYRGLPTDLKNNYALVLAGSPGWNSEDLVEKIKSYQQTGEKIILSGYVNDDMKASLYKRATLVVVPSVYEGFGMPILEAMSYGAAVAASDIKVFKEVAADGALYFSPHSADSTRSCLQKALTDTKLRQSMIKRGHQKVKQFSWQGIASTIYDRIRALAQ